MPIKTSQIEAILNTRASNIILVIIAILAMARVGVDVQTLIPTTIRAWKCDATTTISTTVSAPVAVPVEPLAPPVEPAAVPVVDPPVAAPVP